MKKKRKQSILQGRSGTVILVVAIAVLLVSMWMSFGHELFDAWRAKNVEENTKKLYYSSALPQHFFSLFPTAEAETLTAEEQQDAQEQTELPPIHEDFAQLHAVNDDVVGWIKAGVRIDYPVVFRDNWFYLNRNFFRDRDSNGTIFMNQFNSLIPRSDVIMLHGHNTNSGAMFAELIKFEHLEYVKEHPLVTFRTIYDPEDVYYTPVFGFHASMNETHPEYVNIARFDFDEEASEEGTTDANALHAKEEFQVYLDELASVSLWQANTDVNTDDQLLLLVTCSYHQTNGRFVLVCRQLREGETPEEIEALYAEAE